MQFLLIGNVWGQQTATIKAGAYFSKDGNYLKFGNITIDEQGSYQYSVLNFADYTVESRHKGKVENVDGQHLFMLDSSMNRTHTSNNQEKMKNEFIKNDRVMKLEYSIVEDLYFITFNSMCYLNVTELISSGRERQEKNEIIENYCSKLVEK